ncbi:MAG: adenine phosphoribosyltransferase [Microbacteriaceae bacterium]|jgi:adenine phosphoribosyltransferase|nr:adenine phosphoribosyltransferase [Microbacteriaceae bacterium]
MAQNGWMSSTANPSAAAARSSATAATSAAGQVERLLTSVPDFPTAGILFRDLSPVFADATAFRVITEELVAPYLGRIDVVGGVEARGFVLAASAALAGGAGLVVIRKSGKLPAPVLRESYSLEYGTAELEMHAAPFPGQRMLILDDVLATGGTLAAAVRLAERAGYQVVGIGVVLELAQLDGAAALPGRELRSIVSV